MLQQRDQRSDFPWNAEWLRQQERQVAVYLAKVMGWMCVGLLTTLAVGLLIVGIPQVAYRLFSSNMVYAIILAQLAVAIGMGAALHRISSGAATVLFMAYAALTGVTFASLFFLFETFSLISVFGICAVVFLAMAVYGFTARKDLTRIGRLAFFGLLGVIVASLVNLWLGNGMLDLIITVIGVGIFVVLIAYDTQRIKAFYLDAAAQGMDERSPALQKMAIYGALTLYLDFINLFIKLVYLVGRRRD